MKNTKERKEREARYVTGHDMEKHFSEVIDSSVKIMNRQFKKIGKCAKGRTFQYTPEQIEKLNAYLLEQTEKVRQRLLRTVEQEQEFNI